MLKILTRMKKTIQRKRCAESILAGFLAICMAVTGIPFGKLRLQAEGEAEVYQIYATFPPEGQNDFTDFEVAAEQPYGKGLYAKLIRNGSYTVTAEDSNLPLWIDNGVVTNPDNYEVNFGDIRLSGNSSLDMGSYKISSIVGRFPAFNSEPINQGTVSVEALQSFYNSSTYVGENAKLYDYTFTGDTTWIGWRNMETLTVNNGVTLTITKGHDDEQNKDFATTIEAQNAVINGTVLVWDSTLEAANMLTILDGGSLTVGDGASLSGSGNGCLEIRGGATVSGITLYDGDGTTEFHDFSHTEMFAWNGENSRWVRQAGGGPGGGSGGRFPDNKYRIIKNGDGEPGLTVNDAPSQFDEGNAERDFSVGSIIEFTITGSVYKVILVTNDSEQELMGEDGSYSYIPASESGFEIVVYTSEEAFNYDQCRPGEGEFFVEYQVRYRDEEANNGDNKVTCDSAGLGGNFVSSVTYGEWTKLILKNEVTSVRLTIVVAEGYEYVVNPNSISVHDDVIDWDVSSGDRSARPEISFEKSRSGGAPDGPDGPDGPGPRPVGPEELQGYIEGQQYAFGDWDEDGDVDAADVRLGMAYQIFYPMFSGNTGLQEEYQLSGHQSLLDDNIAVSAAPDKNISAKDADGISRTIPAYSYTVTLTRGTGETAETITATGTAYAFSFSDGSKYQKNNRGCVIAVTEKNNVKSYFLRCANAYAAGTKSDTKLMVSGGNPDEAPIVVVSDFDVIYDEQEKTYDRKVSVFGNGAGLDALFSQEEDKDIVAYQGRNEDLIRDIGKGASWGSIFSVFTFCQESFEGVQVKGSGASGNTPSWAFNQYPVFSTDDAEMTEKEAVVYFGNPTVTIRPVDSLTGVEDDITGIESVELADSDIPTAAVEIDGRSDTEWKVNFLSDFYDQVKVKIVYKLQDGSTKTSYLNIHRVGIDILDGNGRNGMTLFHGTENGPTYNAEGKELVIWGTYYYPQATTGDVDLYVTYTWKDGSVTKRTINNVPSLNMAAANGNCQSSDFILYEGTNTDAPTKIEAIAVASGFDNTASFGGAKFGAGKGVVWNNYLGNGGE